jgi:hypothetical protein
MTEESAFNVYQVLVVKAGEEDQGPAFSKIFKLPKNIEPWLADLACLGIVHKNSDFSRQGIYIHKAMWDEDKNKWIGIKHDKT